MTQSLSWLAVLAALVAASLKWEIPVRAEPAPAPAAVVSAPAAVPVRTKPRVKNKIQVLKDNSASSDGALGITDNSNSSYAALGLRAVPPGFSSSCGRAAGRLQGAWRDMLALKHRAWKSILGRVT